jgi:pimeloyl-ACP methyl ester carboxylesterase
MTQAITSQLLNLDGMDFEIYMCGDQSSKKLALFLHGFPECAHAWRFQMKLLADMGYKCWAPNQRGYGDSYSPPEASQYSMDYLRADVARFIGAAQCESVVLIGHDWGGAVAWSFALSHTMPLDKLVIMNAPFPYLFFKELKKWRQIKKSWYMFLFKIPGLPEYFLTRNNGDPTINIFFKGIKLTEEDVAIYRNNALRTGGMKAMLNWYKARRIPKRLDEKNTISSKNKLQVPTLVVWGEKDVALGINCILGTEKYVENLTIRYLPKAGHFLVEQTPDVVNTILKSWLLGENVPGADEPSIKEDK